MPVCSIASRMRGTSPPGSMTAPRFVVSSHSKVQFCWKAVTGTIPPRNTESAISAASGL
jgi:hypothetical protein